MIIMSVLSHYGLGLHWGWVALDLSERLPGTSIVRDSLQKMTLKLNEDTLYSEGVWTRSRESS